MHMSDPDEKAWIRDRIEGPEKNITFTDNGKKAILNKMIQAEGLEISTRKICRDEKIWFRWRGFNSGFGTNYQEGAILVRRNKNWYAGD